MSVASFSVVIPVFNKERHVLRCIDSVFSQTLAPAEIIVVDDSSSDRSIELIKSAAGDRVRILVRGEPGPGGYAARNLAIDHATGEWIAFLDADDAWEPNHLATLNEVIQREGNDVGCVFSGYVRREPSGELLKDWYSARQEPAGRRTGVHILADWLRRGCPLWMGAVTVRKDIIDRAGQFPAGKCRRGGDRVLWLKVILRTLSSYTGRTTATYYCDSDNMVTKQERFSTRYLQQVIRSEIAQHGSETDILLKKMFNDECFTYVYKSWTRGLSLESADAEGFFTGLAPLRLVAIRLMLAFPLPIPAWARERVRQLRGRATKGA
jgi:succinoglycan biosynthesis protein ExoO